MAHHFIFYIFRGIAQLVEQRSPKPRAEGSNPSAPATKNVRKRCNEAVCGHCAILCFSVMNDGKRQM